MDSLLRFEIGEDIKARASNCWDCHICLEDPEFALCRVDFYVERQDVMISNHGQCRKCGYGQAFAAGHICVCPVRFQLFKLYDT